MSFAKEWEQEFRKWIDRLIKDDCWEIHLVADPGLVDRACVVTDPGARMATISYQPQLPPRISTACHEVVHILLSPLVTPAEGAAKRLPEPANEVMLDRLTAAGETVARLITARLMEAYGFSAEYRAERNMEPAPK